MLGQIIALLAGRADAHYREQRKQQTETVATNKKEDKMADEFGLDEEIRFQLSTALDALNQLNLSSIADELPSLNNIIDEIIDVLTTDDMEA